MTTAVERQPTTAEALQAENAELRRRLEEAEETIRAIQSGAVDALVVEEPQGHRVYTLEGAERPYRLMVEEMQQGAATLYSDGTIAYCNRQLAELLRLPHEKLIGAALHDFIAPDDRAVYDNLLWQGQSRAGRGEARLRRADGGLVPAYLTFNVLPKDCGAAIGVLITDLTAQRHHEQLTAAHNALRQSEEQFRQLADAMPQFVWAARPDGYIDYYNERWYEYTGFSRNEYGRQSWEPILHPDDVQPCVDAYFGCIKAEQPYQIEYRFKDPRTGGFRWFLGRAMPVRNEQGTVVRWFGTCTDIDDTKRLQEELREADRRKDEFLAMLAHELRGPLAPLRNMLEIMKRADGNGAVIQQAVRTMDRQLSQLSRLTDDLLDVSRISRGKTELKRERVELASVVQQAVEACRPLAEDAHHQVNITLPPEPIHLDADPVRLAQVLSNLLNNSCKYTEPGGQIWLTAQRQGSDAVVKVRDTGVGIPPGKLSSIFDMFTQIDPTLERSQGGLGIGLTLVRRLVEMHGGTVEAFSEGPGRGSEFVLRLPLLIESEKPPEPAVGQAAATTVRRILVVDDNHDSATSLAMLLKLTGNETQTAFDGLEAVEAASTFKPDLVLLDIGLPKLNGYEACRRIREQPWSKGMLLIALTGWGQEEDRQKSRQAGFNAHMVKPVDLAALTKLLGELKASTGPSR